MANVAGGTHTVTLALTQTAGNPNDIVNPRGRLLVVASG
jgi:hypothetical protein